MTAARGELNLAKPAPGEGQARPPRPPSLAPSPAPSTPLGVACLPPILMLVQAHLLCAGLLQQPLPSHPAPPNRLPPISPKPDMPSLALKAPMVLHDSLWPTKPYKGRPCPCPHLPLTHSHTDLPSVLQEG